MKKKTTAVLTAVSLSALMAVGGTMAWFSDAGMKVNTVTLGNLELAISEPEWDKSDKIVIPGDVVNKDPHIQNVNDVAAYTGIIIQPHKILSERDILRYHVPGGAEDEFLNTMELGKYWSTTGKTTTVDGKEYDIVALPTPVVDALLMLIHGGEDDLGYNKEQISSMVTDIVEYAKTEEAWDTNFLALGGADVISTRRSTSGGVSNNDDPGDILNHLNSVLNTDYGWDQITLFVALDSKDNPDNEIVLFDQIKFDEVNMTNDLYDYIGGNDVNSTPCVVSYAEAEHIVVEPQNQKTGVAISFIATQMKHNEADTAVEGVLGILDNNVVYDIEKALMEDEANIPESDYWTDK